MHDFVYRLPLWYVVGELESLVCDVDDTCTTITQGNHRYVDASDQVLTESEFMYKLRAYMLALGKHLQLTLESGTYSYNYDVQRVEDDKWQYILKVSSVIDQDPQFDVDFIDIDYFPLAVTSDQLIENYKSVLDDVVCDINYQLTTRAPTNYVRITFDGYTPASRCSYYVDDVPYIDLRCASNFWEAFQYISETIAP